MHYIHRDVKGVMKGVYNSSMMKEIAVAVDGKWRPHNTEDNKTRCFEVTSDNSLTLTQGDIQLRIYFWRGDFIVEKTS